MREDEYSGELVEISDQQLATRSKRWNSASTACGSTLAIARHIARPWRTCSASKRAPSASRSGRRERTFGRAQKTLMRFQRAGGVDQAPHRILQASSERCASAARSGSSRLAFRPIEMTIAGDGRLLQAKIRTGHRARRRAWLGWHCNSPPAESPPVADAPPSAWSAEALSNASRSACDPPFCVSACTCTSMACASCASAKASCTCAITPCARSHAWRSDLPHRSVQRCRHPHARPHLGAAARPAHG